METLLQKAKSWEPLASDKQGKDKKAFLKYLITYCSSRSNARTIDTIRHDLNLYKSYSREEFQRLIMGPLREDKAVFIGTSSSGIYLITDADSAYTTIDFYTNRIRSERRHLRNLKWIVKKNKLFHSQRTTPPNKKSIKIFFDESGTPSLNNIETDPFFLVTAVLLYSKGTENLLWRKFDLIRKEFSMQDGAEIKSSSLNVKKYEFILAELSTLDFEFASVCFKKKELFGNGFNYSKSFYKYAYKFLLENVVEYAGTADLFFDEYSSKNSPFYKEFSKYINNNTSSVKTKNIKFVDSKIEPGVQLADLMGGIIKNKLKGKGDLLSHVDDKLIDVVYFP